MALAQVTFVVRLSGRVGSLFQGTTVSNPFSDRHAVSTLSDVNVDDLDRVETSTYQNETTDRRL